MDYRPSEIADLLKVSVDTVYRSYIPAGCPHERDETGHIWILGTAFKAWAEEILAERKRKKSPPMKPDEGWCLNCNERVKMNSPKIIYSARNREIIQSFCKKCGGKVNRARKRND